jgi:hypothetical protein
VVIYLAQVLRLRGGHLASTDLPWLWISAAKDVWCAEGSLPMKHWLLSAHPSNKYEPQFG